jgi:hypothetical protein
MTLSLKITPKNIINLLKKNIAGTYVETGFASGNSAKFALDLGFKKVISIEIDKESVIKGREKFHKFIKSNKLELIHGESSVELEKVLKKHIDVSVIFLDAHDGDHLFNAPIEKELDVIKKYYNKQIIIIDDFQKIKYNKLNPLKNYWGKKNNYNKIISKFEKEFNDEVTEIYLNNFLRITCYLINKKVPLHIKNIFSEIQYKIFMFFFPVLIFVRRFFKRFLFTILTEEKYNKLINNYYKLIHKFTKI